MKKYVVYSDDHKTPIICNSNEEIRKNFNKLTNEYNEKHNTDYMTVEEIEEESAVKYEDLGKLLEGCDGIYCEEYEYYLSFIEKEEE